MLVAYERGYEKGYETDYEKQNFIGVGFPRGRKSRGFSFSSFLTSTAQHRLRSGKKKKKKEEAAAREKR